MNTLTLFILAVGLAMDAFAAAVCKSLAISRLTAKEAVTVGLWFGVFQALMPLIGFLLGCGFREKIAAFDHWIAFILLSAIGINMIREAASDRQAAADTSLACRTMFILSLATSIDALAVGVTFAFLDVNIWYATTLIGAVTFAISLFGAKIGSIFGAKHQSKAEFAGGAILIILGLKILLDHIL